MIIGRNVHEKGRAISALCLKSPKIFKLHQNTDPSDTADLQPRFLDLGPSASVENRQSGGQSFCKYSASLSMYVDVEDWRGFARVRDSQHML
jgi:hypothetical protein